MRSLLKTLLIVSTLFLLFPARTEAQSLNLIRDTEIEYMLEEWFTPIMNAAGIAPSNVNIILVNDDNINAFVAGGSNVFIYTGLLLETEDPSEVIGVFSHELGHIMGGHLVRSREAIARSGVQAVVSTLIGVGAAILSGDGSAAAAGAGFGNALATNNFLAHSRVQESSADQAALTYMQGAGFDPKGFKTFLGKLENQELLPAGQQIEYVRTHPITRDRIENVSTRVENASAKGKAYPAEWAEGHERMQAKLIGFLQPQRVAQYYPDSDQSIAAQYARVIAAYRKNEFKGATDGLNALIANEPKNPYFRELMGQILRDGGQLEQAVAEYEMADKYIADSALIKIEMAHVLLETAPKNKEEKGQILKAVQKLKEAVKIEPQMSYSYRLLATAYGRMGENGLAKLYLAEEGLVKRDYDYARRQVEAALKELKKGTPDYIRAQDLQLVITQKQAEQDS